MFSDTQLRRGIILITVGEAHGNSTVIPPEALKGRNISWMPRIYRPFRAGVDYDIPLPWASPTVINISPLCG